MAGKGGMADVGWMMPREKALLVAGGLNASPMDRTLVRSEVCPLQLIVDGRVERVEMGRSWGGLGVSALAWSPTRPEQVYVTTGGELALLDLEKKTGRRIDVGGLRDVHEMTVLGRSLWLANTGWDELVELHVDGERVGRRVGLRGCGSDEAAGGGEGAARREDVTRAARFHCNQVFESYEGGLWCLVHHVSGTQSLMRMGRKLIKFQGDGGVIALTTGRRIGLGLNAPHSVRRIDGDYWILDSGRARINIYGRDWELRSTLATSGWGRGADYLKEERLVYVGISETRRRYLGIRRIGGAAESPNMVEVFDARKGEPVGGRILGTGIEQINNVYVIERELAETLLDCTEIVLD